MIVLDTNVLSELVRATPDTRVLTWLDALPVAETATTAVTVAELHHGVARLPDGRRRVALHHAVRAMLDDDFRGRVEPFDRHAARAYAHVVADRERLGRPISVADAQIAAICRARGATLATRNTKDFKDTGIELIDPWQVRRAGSPVAGPGSSSGSRASVISRARPAARAMPASRVQQSTADPAPVPP